MAVTDFLLIVAIIVLAFTVLFTGRHEETVFSCPDPAFNSDAGYDERPVEYYQEQCEWIRVLK